MIEVEPVDDVSVVRLVHGRANVLDTELLTALLETLESAEIDDTSAVVLTGTGSAFSAGVDLYRVIDGGTPYLKVFLPLLRESFETLFLFPKPVVAAVNGHAIAGGCVVAGACDYRLMADGPGRIGTTELKVGVPFPTSALEILRFAVGEPVAQQLAYTGDLYSPAEALQFGLVHEVTEPDDLQLRAVDVAMQLAEIPPQSFALTKRTLRQPHQRRIESETADIDSEVFAAWQTAETMKSVAEFMERIVAGKQ